MSYRHNTSGHIKFILERIKINFSCSEDVMCYAGINLRNLGSESLPFYRKYFQQYHKIRYGIFRISELSLNFPKISWTLLFCIVMHDLDYHRFCARWLPKLLLEDHKKQRLTASLTFIKDYYENGEFLFYHVLTGDKTCVTSLHRLPCMVKVSGGNAVQWWK